jgi:hypothetical protein
MLMAQAKGSNKRKIKPSSNYLAEAEDFALDAWSMLWWSLRVGSRQEAQ